MIAPVPPQARTAMKAAATSRRKPTYEHKLSLLSSPFKFDGGRHVWGCARLYPDRVELRGVGWDGRYRRSIPLVETIDMEYRPLPGGEGRINLVLETGEEVPLVVRGAQEWRQSFESWMSYHVLAGAKLLPEADLAVAIAG